MARRFIRRLSRLEKVNTERVSRQAMKNFKKLLISNERKALGEQVRQEIKNQLGESNDDE
jgi:hypothetical protein